MPSHKLEVVIISLDTATHRRQMITSMLEGTSLSWRFFDAHRGLLNASLQYDPEQAIQTAGAAFGPQHLGVYSSHFSAMQTFLKEGRSDYVLILEDDVILDTAFPFETFAEYCAKLGMDYVRLFGRYSVPARKLGYFRDRNLVRYRTSPLGAQAYILTRRGAERLTADLRSVRDFNDIATDRFWATKLPLYGIYPCPVIERFSPTQIPVAQVGSTLSPKERVLWYGFKIKEKIRKIFADHALLMSDKRMSSKTNSFGQIEFSTGEPVVGSRSEN